ncbi:Asp_protease_2 domain-containing protein [Cucumis melo var. makuwa]|uniref:Asp_protease_2 domain-containing protein n=1 Tax=Cucumis melo var. makuwa TaxID=1194695 RepID=A0A5A7VIJ6_CUCMM|nr:Asp_protease_2 domain-containing protein [Cucumis melo var. makuwa]
MLAERGLMYVDTWINQKLTKSTMVDSNATHNFIIEVEARRLSLHWEKDTRRMKVVNSIALPTVKLAKPTMIKLGGWNVPVNFMIVKMDDFDVLLEMEFLLEHKVIPMPLAKCIVIIGFVPHCWTFVSLTVPKDIFCVLEKYRDVMPDSLPKSLSSRRMIDHEIELLPRAKPPVKNAYYMALSELAELHKQLDELLSAGLIRPAKTPYGA